MALGFLAARGFGGPVDELRRMLVDHLNASSLSCLLYTSDAADE